MHIHQGLHAGQGEKDARATTTQSTRTCAHVCVSAITLAFIMIVGLSTFPHRDTQATHTRTKTLKAPFGIIQRELHVERECLCMNSTGCSNSSHLFRHSSSQARHHNSSCCPGSICQFVHHHNISMCVEHLPRNTTGSASPSCTSTNSSGCVKSRDCCNPFAHCHHGTCLLSNNCSWIPLPGSGVTKSVAPTPYTNPLSDPNTPTQWPTNAPYPTWNINPTLYPTWAPNPTSGPYPTESPSSYPTNDPYPTWNPNPTSYPGSGPYPSGRPSSYPTPASSLNPTWDPYPTTHPYPSWTAYPTWNPDPNPTANPTWAPVAAIPTWAPNPVPSPTYPVSYPNSIPTSAPINPTAPVAVADSSHVALIFENYINQDMQVFINDKYHSGFEPVAFLPSAASGCTSVVFTYMKNFNGALKALPACSSGSTQSNLAEFNNDDCATIPGQCVDWYDLSNVASNTVCATSNDPAVCGGQYTTGLSIIPLGGSGAQCSSVACTSQWCDTAYQYPDDNAGNVYLCVNNNNGYTIQLLPNGASLHASGQCRISSAQAYC